LNRRPGSPVEFGLDLLDPIQGGANLFCSFHDLLPRRIDVDHMPQDQEFDKTAVVTIQGGGVYGLGLLGQLAALVYQFEIAPLALAATSAGAIIATLYWAGYTPKDIRDLLIKEAIPKNASKDSGLVTLLDPTRPSRRDHRYKHFKAFSRRAVRAFGLDDPPGALPRPSRPRGRIASMARLPGSAYCFLRLAWSLRPHIRRNGFFSGDKLEAFIERCLRNSPKLKGKFPQDTPPLTFGMVRELGRQHPGDDESYFCPLILTATNLSTRELVLIRSYELEDEGEGKDTKYKFADLSIAKAVRASAGVPFFLRPVQMTCGMERGWYVDGGVISNFPAWVFSSELRRQLAKIDEYRDVARRPWLSIGLKQVERPKSAEAGRAGNGATLGFRDFAGSILGLLTGQARNELESALTTRLPRHVAVDQLYDETGFKDKDFLKIDELKEDKINAMYGLGYACAGEKLKGRSFNLPRKREEDRIEGVLKKLISQALRVFSASDNKDLKFRANVYIPQEDTLSLRYHVYMKDHPDQALTFRMGGPGIPYSGLTGACFTTRHPWLCNLEILQQLAKARPGESFFGMTAAEHEIVRDDRTWLASVPIFDPRDSWFQPTEVRRPKRLEGDFFLASELSTVVDGAVFGVLNLDAALPYGPLNFDRDMEEALKDPRTEAIIAILHTASIRIGLILSDAFGVEKSHA
jgi:predicted acylesterase/phospholipase RssA